MKIKICIKCKKRKKINEFYKHSGMKDGHLNECKECTKIRTKKERINNIEYIREYDRKRGKLQYRKDKCKIYSINNREKFRIYSKKYRLKNKEKLNKYNKKWLKNNPEKRNAHIKLNNAIISKKIIKNNKCSICKKTGNINGHHSDYKKPLEDIWLCDLCHSLIHKIKNDIKSCS